jgi:hypothetical protein
MSTSILPDSLEVVPAFETSAWQHDPLYAQLITSMLKRILPDLSFLSPLEAAVETPWRGADVLHQMLPIVSWSIPTSAPCTISFLLLCRYRPHAFSFFYEWVTRWMALSAGFLHGA